MEFCVTREVGTLCTGSDSGHVANVKTKASSDVS